MAAVLILFDRLSINFCQAGEVLAASAESNLVSGVRGLGPGSSLRDLQVVFFFSSLFFPEFGRRRHQTPARVPAFSWLTMAGRAATLKKPTTDKEAEGERMAGKRFLKPEKKRFRL